MIYCFGAFELDAAARELRRDGQRVDIEPKAFDLLSYLIAHRDRAVSKEDLLTSIWPQAIVSETALARCVMKARRAVGDETTDNSVIRTIHGHGYRFVAEVLERDDPLAMTTARLAAVPRRTRWRAGLMVGGFIVVAATLSFLTLFQREASALDNGSLAVLPVVIDIDGDYEWARLGMMSLMRRVIEDAGLDVVHENDVLRVVGDDRLERAPGIELIERLRSETRTTAVLHTVLEAQGGLHRLSAILTHPDGSQLRRVIVAKQSAELATEMGSVIATVLSGGLEGDGDRFSRVAVDPFVNEMYARALDLELRGDLEAARALFRSAADQAPELFWLRYEIALCTRDLKEEEEAERQFLALREEAENSSEARALVATLNSLGILYLNQNRLDESEAVLSQAYDATNERSLLDERASIAINLGLIDTRRSLYTEAREHYDDAFDIYDELEREPAGYLLNNYAGLLIRLGDLDTALAFSERAVDAFRVRGQRRYEAPAMNRLARIYRRLGRTEEAIARHEEAAAIYEDLGNTRGQLGVVFALSTVYREMGDLTRARRSAEHLLESASELGDSALVADAHYRLGQLAQDVEAHSTALEHLTPAIEAFASVNNIPGRRAAVSATARSRAALGDMSNAMLLADELLAGAIARESGTDEAWTRCLMGELAMRRGDTADALDQYSLALEFAREIDHSTLRLTAGIGLAEASLANDDLNSAERLLDEVAGEANERPEYARAAARLAIAKGEGERARSILGELRLRSGELWRRSDAELLASIDPAK